MRKAWEQNNYLADIGGTWDKKEAIDTAIFLQFFLISNFLMGRHLNCRARDGGAVG